MSPRFAALTQLTLARIREFYREPAAVFWVYVFPILIAVALGIAFRERPVERISVDVLEDVGSPAAASALLEKLKADERLVVKTASGEEWKKRLQAGKTDLVVAPAAGEGFDVWSEPNRPESVLAKHAVESVLFKGPNAPVMNAKQLEGRGQRYIDFLLPGLLGMNLMGGGLFGVGFVLADMRVRKLLKRFLATPMRRGDFLLSIAASRVIFTIPEVLALLLFGWLVFGVRNAGSFLSLLTIIVLGACCFGSIGLLVASRAKTIETVSGLMNLVMLPMWVLSGVFFSSERFPTEVQPMIRMLPLTALNDALRKIMLEGRSLIEVSSEVIVMLAWGVISFVIALRIFRWQ